LTTLTHIATTPEPRFKTSGEARPLVSVVIVNYNVKDFLLQCLRSLQQSSVAAETEIIVVDNDSSDGSLEFLKPLFPEVHFIASKENLGFGRANNLGINIAKGEFILLLNPDTIVSENTLEKMAEYMRAHTEVGMCGCKVLNPDGTFQLACRRGFPTPWASFCKIFGLQSLFPNSKLFAQYNQTFRSTDETYYIDALIGAFMFARREALLQAEGFDPAFFMYGEDLDLCYRIQQNGWKVAYVPTTSIIHFKGESTRRSTLNEIKVFYQAMEIFAKKHFSASLVFLTFLRLGIWLRSILAYVNRFKRSLGILLLDVASINLALMVATKVRFDQFLGFPDYAYPTVFIAVTAVMLASMISVGEYFEEKVSFRKAFLGLMVSFFILSSLTYFFKDFGFSRGVLVMTVGLTVVSAALSRIFLSVYDKSLGKEADRRVLIVGLTEEGEKLVNALQTAERRNAHLVGAVSVEHTPKLDFAGLKILGNVDYLPKLIEDFKIHEVVIADTALSQNAIMRIIMSVALPSVRFHIAQEYGDVVAARIISEVSGTSSGIQKYPITRFRYRLLKRAFDIAAGIFFLTIALPIVFLLFKNSPFKKIWRVLKGELSIVGLYPDAAMPAGGKPGLTGLAHISAPKRLSESAIRNLNQYYVEHYSFTLDMDILLKHLFRKNRGI
jgi:GT2 family glycosyltransferase